MRKIIITQDIKALLDREESFLDRADVRIFPVVSNEKALDIHKAEKADIIIASLEANVLSGEQLCSTIRQSKELSNVSLIIIHSGDPSDIQRISACRANAFIEKSSDPTVLLAKTRQLMSIQVRETFRTPICIRVNCDSRRAPSMGYSENISVTGMLLDSEKTLSKGEIISCWFVLPDSTNVTTEAEVVRISARASEHDTNRYGIRFINLADVFRTAIADYVKKRHFRP